MKCDGGWPACNRCISTGRVCDGYGIWGGGGNAYGNRLSFPTSLANSNPTMSCMPVTLTVPTIHPCEQRYLEWFFCRSVVKLPGIFRSGFWDSVIRQASSREPAIFHAILALGAAHKNEVFRKPGRRRSYNLLDEHEQFALHQYSTAINNLQTHFATKDKESIRLTLITCIIFVYVEFLLGNHRTGFLHLRKGVKMLEQFASMLWLSNDPVDQCIVEAFSRNQLQAELLGQISHDSLNAQHTDLLELPTTKFENISQAREYMDLILRQILCLTQLNVRTPGFEQTTLHNELHQRKSYIRVQLATWRKVLTASLPLLKVHTDVKASIAHRILSIYHTMSHIMIETSLNIDQVAFENHTNSFLSILTQLVDLLNTLLSAFKRTTPPPGEESTVFGSIADIAWIPPLYYIATKCRQHRLRMHAIKMLDLNFHKEGAWDSQLAGRVSREVMRIEEGGYYEGFEIDDEFVVTEAPGVEDLTLPVLPESYRVWKFEVQLPNEPGEMVRLKCWRLRENGELEVVLRVLDI